jgi:hypothetical protein
MRFQVLPLDAAPFAPLYGLSDAELAGRGARACTADAPTGFPCRVTLRDAVPGERLILLNHEHLRSTGPYRSRHAIFVIDGARTAAPVVGAVPAMLRERLLSVRAFDAAQMMLDADVVDGREAAPLFERLLADAAVAFLHVHSARRGCYLARIERIG